MTEREKYPLNPSGLVSNLSVSSKFGFAIQWAARGMGQHLWLPLWFWIAMGVVSSAVEEAELAMRCDERYARAKKSGDLWLIMGKHYDGNCLHDFTSRMQSKSRM